MSDDLLVEVDEHGVMIATFNRPEAMNSLTNDIRLGLRDAIETASTDDAVRVLVITGVGRAFCAGAQVTADRDPSDVQEAPTRHQRLDHVGGSGRMVEIFQRCDVPVIAAINGVTAGAGFGIALCCDVRIAAESARIGPIFIKRGLSTDTGAAYWLPRIVGAARAFEILYDGSLIEAPRALELGLVNRVVPDDQLQDVALNYARQIAAGPPLAYTYQRRLLQQSIDTGMHDIQEREWIYQSALLRTKDAGEGFAAFRERREPKFIGE